jgi:hypothetical protein
MEEERMMRYATLAELHAAYETGKLDRDCVLWIDNDQTVVHRTAGDDYETVFEMHPEDLLEQALDLLGIPRNHV